MNVILFGVMQPATPVDVLLMFIATKHMAVVWVCYQGTCWPLMCQNITVSHSSLQTQPVTYTQMWKQHHLSHTCSGIIFGFTCVNPVSSS